MTIKALLRWSVRDILWATAVVALVCTLGIECRHASDAEKARLQEMSRSYYRRWHFDVVATVLKARTGEVASVEQRGVVITSPSGRAVVYHRQANGQWTESDEEADKVSGAD